MIKKARFSKLVFGVVSVSLLFLFSCGGAKGKGASEPVRTGNPKYDSFFEKADKFEADIKAARDELKKNQADLAVAVGLKANASIEQIRDAIRTAIETAVVKAGGHVEVTIEGGIFSRAGASISSEGAGAGAEMGGEIKVNIQVVGDVQVSAEVQKIIDAARISLEGSARIATKLKEISLQVPDLINEAGQLSVSVASDLDPITAAKVTARLTGLTGIFKEVSGLFDTSFNFTVEVKASFTMEASGEASASAGT